MTCTTTTAASPLPGFYEGVRETPAEVLEQWHGLDLTPESFLGPVGLGLPAGERGRMLIEQIQSRPTCDVNGILGGYTGEGTKTVIAGQASAKISFRLVDDQDPEAIAASFESFVRARIPADCAVEIVTHKGSRGSRCRSTCRRSPRPRARSPRSGACPR